MNKILVEEMSKKIQVINDDNKNMLYFLRLRLHNYLDKDICKFLKISSQELIRLESKILLKFNCKDFESAIIKAFETELLNKYDFVNTIVKESALMYANIISENSHKTNSSFYFDDLKDYVLEFYETCENAFLKTEKCKLTHVERSFLEMKFDGYNIESLKSELKINEQEQNGIKDILSKKFEERTWFNIFKKAFQVRVLQKEDYLTLDVYLESLESASKISDIMKLKSDANEKQLLVYYELIHFYNRIEFDYLSKYSS